MKQRQMNLYKFKASNLHSLFHASQGYVERLCIKRTQKEKGKENTAICKKPVSVHLRERWRKMELRDGDKGERRDTRWKQVTRFLEVLGDVGLPKCVSQSSVTVTKYPRQSTWEGKGLKTARIIVARKLRKKRKGCCSNSHFTGMPHDLIFFQ